MVWRKLLFKASFQIFLGITFSVLASGQTEIDEAMKILLHLDHRPSIKEVNSAFGDNINAKTWDLPLTDEDTKEAIRRFVVKNKTQQDEPDVADPKGADTSKFKAQYFSGTLNRSGELGAQDIIKSLISDASALDSIYEVGPELIAGFEKAYPGANIVGIGRDSAFLGDFLDAFYTSEGQQNRVLNLELGRNSFGDSQLLKAYVLQVTKIDFSNLASGPSYVFFDATSFKSSSQSRTLLNLLLSTCLSTPNCNRELFFRKIGFINTGFNIFKYQGNPFDGDESVLKKHFETIVENGKFTEVLSLNVPPSYIYSLEFHQAYKGLKVVENSEEVVTLRGDLEEESIRKLIIRMQVKLIQAASSPKMKARVKQVSKAKYHFNYSDERVVNETMADQVRGFEFPLNSKDDFDLSVKTKDIYRLTRITEKRDESEAKAILLRDWISAVGEKSVKLNFVELIEFGELINRTKLSKKDSQNLFVALLNLFEGVNIPSSAEGFKNLYKSNRYFRDAWNASPFKRDIQRPGICELYLGR